MLMYKKVERVKIGLFYLNGAPGEKVRRLPFIATFVEVGFQPFAIERSDVVLKENGIRNDKWHVPRGFPLRSANGLLPRLEQRCTPLESLFNVCYTKRDFGLIRILLPVGVID